MVEKEMRRVFLKIWWGEVKKDRSVERMSGSDFLCIKCCYGKRMKGGRDVCLQIESSEDTDVSLLNGKVTSAPSPASDRNRYY